MRSPGGGELSLSACPGVGNRPPSEKKIANPRGYARGGMVTGRIEPCIIHTNRDSVRKAREAHLIDKAKALEPQGLNRRDELHL